MSDTGPSTAHVVVTPRITLTLEAQGRVYPIKTAAAEYSFPIELDLELGPEEAYEKIRESVTGTFDPFVANATNDMYRDLVANSLAVILTGALSIDEAIDRAEEMGSTSEGGAE